MLDPAPVGGRFAGETGPGGEAVEFVIVVVGLRVRVLIPHGIGDDAIERAELAAFFSAEPGVLEGVADLDLAFHVVDDHVHVGHGPGLGDVFLAEQFEGQGCVFRLFGGFHFCLHGEFALDEKATGATGGVVDFHARVWGKDAGYDLADFAGSVEFAGALAAALGELADKVFVALADDVGLDVLKPEALGADGLNEVGKAVVVEVALAVGGGVEIDTVDDAFQKRVFPSDFAHMGGDAFADLIGEFADNRPHRLLCIFWHQRQVETNHCLFLIRNSPPISYDQLEGFISRAHLSGDTIQFIIKYIAETFSENKRQDVIFILWRVFCPTNGTRGIPYPGLQRFIVRFCIFLVLRHRCFLAKNPYASKLKKSMTIRLREDGRVIAKIALSIPSCRIKP